MLCSFPSGSDRYVKAILSTVVAPTLARSSPERASPSFPGSGTNHPWSLRSLPPDEAHSLISWCLLSVPTPLEMLHA